MSELKFTLPSFDGKLSSDFHLWQLRLQAILESKSIWYVIEPTPTSVSSAEDNRKAAAIIINGLGDKPLRSVSAHTKEPQTMVKRLREPYASTKLSTLMSLMAELQAMRYKTGDMAEYVDEYAALRDRLEAMNAKVPSDLAIIMFLHLMDGKFEGTSTALRTLGCDKLTWDDVTARLIEEFNTSFKCQSSGGNATAIVTSASKQAAVCTRCGKTVHEFSSCWWNPDNPRNKLGNSNRTSDSKARVNNASTKTRLAEPRARTYIIHHHPPKSQRTRKRRF
jgi:gag-polypeptide of LTR copia-type